MRHNNLINRKLMQDSKYLVATDRDAQWGLVVNTVGYDEVSPEEHYPTKGHADGYNFDIERGRILDEYQMLYLLEGEGVFSSKHVRDVHIKAGDIFLLFPGEWHTYHPMPGSPWKSYWIGYKGRNMDDRLKYGFLSLEKPVYHVGFSNDIVYLYDSAIKTAKEEPAHCQQILAGIVNNLLGLMYSLERSMELSRKGGYVDMINRARLRIREGVEEKITVQEIADGLGSSYSNFRKLFKEFTGISPASYQQDLKLQRAKELLTGSEMKVREIVEAVGYADTANFIRKFRNIEGMTPGQYREAGRQAPSHEEERE